SHSRSRRRPRRSSGRPDGAAGQPACRPAWRPELSHLAGWPRCFVHLTITPLTHLPAVLVALTLRAHSMPALMILAVLACPSCPLAPGEPPATVDGPSSDVRAVGGAALAADGAGGIAYIKLDQGVPHVFVVRRLHGAWSAPIRADALPYEARQVAIAAADH